MNGETGADAMAGGIGSGHFIVGDDVLLSERYKCAVDTVLYQISRLVT